MVNNLKGQKLGNFSSFLNFYCPRTKLRECNVFTGVCLSTGDGYVWSQVPSRGGYTNVRYTLGQVYQEGWYTGGGWVYQGVGIQGIYQGGRCTRGWVYQGQGAGILVIPTHPQYILHSTDF